MKKIKFIIGVALVCALAFTCFAFVGCGDPFNIDTSTPATDEQYKEFTAKVAAANSDVDTLFGMPAAYKDKSIKLEMNTNTAVSGEGVNSNVTIVYSAIMNYADKVSAKITANVSESTTMGGSTVEDNAVMEMIIVDGMAYQTVTEKGETEKTKNKFEDDIINDIIGDSVSGTETAKDLTSFIAQIKTAVAVLGITGEPKVYIKGGVMKVVLSEKSYVGVAYDGKWNLDKFKFVVDNESVSIGGMAATISTKLTISVVKAETITAPSDAGEYTESGTGII